MRELLSRFETTTTRVDIDGESYEIVHPRDAESLIDEAAFNHDERLPYWADIWPSSLALARMIRGMKGDGHTLLELGCGIGLVASVAVRAGFEVTVSDYYQDALEFAVMNAKANSGREPASLVLDWRDLPTHIPAFDYVAAADVLYERNNGAVVATTIATTLTETGRAFIADPGRVGSHVFFDALRDLGLKHVGATVIVVPLHDRDHSIMVHEITRLG